MIEIHPLTGIGEVLPKSDLVAILAESFATAGLQPLHSDDALVVTQKIVSKAEDRFVDLRQVTPGAEARRLAEVTRKDPRLVELVLAESTMVVRAVPNVLACGFRGRRHVAPYAGGQGRSGARLGRIGPGPPRRCWRLADRLAS